MMQGLPARIVRRFFRDANGGTAIMAAVIMTMSILLTAIAVDGGALYLERRKMQSLTDLAAIVSATSTNAPQLAARRFMDENGYSGLTVASAMGSSGDLIVESGNYKPDPAIPVESRFRPGTTPFNATRVTFTREGQLYFGGSFMRNPQIRTSGLAYASADAAFSIGSRLASIDGGLLNAILGELIGSTLSLSVMDYRALLATRIEVLKFLDQAASELNITAGTYNDVLESSLSLAQITQIAAAVVQSGNGQAASALTTLSGTRGASSMEIPLNHLIDLGALGAAAIGTGSAIFQADVGVMEFVGAGAAIADGTNQVRLSLDSAIPGIANLTADLAIGEPPQSSGWFAVGSEGTIVRTAQTRLYIRATVGGTGLLSAVTVTLPVYVELAYGEARLAAIDCMGGKPQGLNIDIEARPGIAGAWIGEVQPARMRRFDTSPAVDRATFVNTGLIKARGRATADIGNTAFQKVSFDYQDVQNGTVKSVSTRNYTAPLIATLLGDLDIDVDIHGLGLTSPQTVTSLVALSLQPAAVAIDAVVYNLLTVLGVKVGEADIRVNGARCQRAVLVQ